MKKNLELKLEKAAIYEAKSNFLKENLILDLDMLNLILNYLTLEIFHFNNLNLPPDLDLFKF